MKSTVKLQIATALLTLCSTAALTVRADPDTYEGRRVRGVDTQNGGAVQTRNGAAAVNTKNGGAVQTRRGGTAVNGPNGTAVETRNGNVYTNPSDNGGRQNGNVVKGKNGNVVKGQNGTAVRTPDGVYTNPK
jgi:hypothetical protein